MNTYMNIFSKSKLVPIMLLLIAPSYQVYHNLIANDMEIKKQIVVIKKTWVKTTNSYDTFFTYKDGNITRVEQVTRGIYDGTPIFSTVEIEKPNPDVSNFLIFFAIMEYILCAVYCLSKVWE